MLQQDCKHHATCQSSYIELPSLQVINFFTQRPIDDPAALVYPLNSIMSPDVQFASIKARPLAPMHWEQCSIIPVKPDGR